MGYNRTITKRGTMQIKINDTITDERGRTGKIINIGIATSKTDIAGEDGVDAKEYDTDLNYTGAITFCNEENNSTYWCYFMDIKEVNNKAVKIDLTDWIG